MGAAVIPTDAVVSIVTSIKISVSGLAGVITAQVLAFALLIGELARTEGHRFEGTLVSARD